MFPLEKYRYVCYTQKDGVKVVIAMSTYGGKTVKGVAKCNPHDSYDEAKGKELAAARCNLKIAELRYKNACNVLEETKFLLDEIIVLYENYKEYKHNSKKKLKEAKKHLEKFDF